jgi:hypothetical protein
VKKFVKCACQFLAVLIRCRAGHGGPALQILVLILVSFSVKAEPRFELVKVADGIFAAIRTEPPGLTVNANTVFIINQDDVVVVDTTLTPGTAREEIAALKRIV